MASNEFERIHGRFSVQSSEAFERAKLEASQLNHDFVESGHLWLALLSEGEFAEKLSGLGLEIGEVRNSIERTMAWKRKSDNFRESEEPKLREVITHSAELASGENEITPTHLLKGLFTTDSNTAFWLFNDQVTPGVGKKQIFRKDVFEFFASTVGPKDITIWQFNNILQSWDDRPREDPGFSF